jgi:hypothetical protein
MESRNARSCKRDLWFHASLRNEPSTLTQDQKTDYAGVFKVCNGESQERVGVMNQFVRWKGCFVPRYLRGMRSGSTQTARVVGIIGILVIALCGSPSRANEVVWGFEGVVTRVGDENTPSQLTVGSRFSGILRFNTEPVGTTLYPGNAGLMQYFVWNGPAIGLDVAVAGLQFSTSGRSDSFFSMNVRDGQFSIPEHTLLDSLMLEGTSDLRHDVIPPGQIGGGDSWYARYVGLEFHDFDLRVFSDVTLQTTPPDLREMEIATITAGVVFGEGRIPTTFGGTVDRIYVIPEANSGLLLGAGLIVILIALACSGLARTRGSAVRRA